MRKVWWSSFRSLLRRMSIYFRWGISRRPSKTFCPRIIVPHEVILPSFFSNHLFIPYLFILFLSFFFFRFPLSFSFCFSFFRQGVDPRGWLEGVWVGCDAVASCSLSGRHRDFPSLPTQTIGCMFPPPKPTTTNLALPFSCNYIYSFFQNRQSYRSHMHRKGILNGVPISSKANLQPQLTCPAPSSLFSTR